MKKIRLPHGKYTIVDDDDFDNLNQYKWHVHTKGYAVRHGKSDDGLGRTIRMHREILCAPEGLQVDHINRDKLDNRKNNLRLCNNSQNHMNKNVRVDNSSGHPGVSWSKISNKWHVYLNIDGVRKNLGFYSDIKRAIAARVKAEKKFYKEFSPK
jgi:hypothetical protein